VGFERSYHGGNGVFDAAILLGLGGTNFFRAKEKPSIRGTSDVSIPLYTFCFPFVLALDMSGVSRFLSFLKLEQMRRVVLLGSLPGKR